MEEPQKTKVLIVGAGPTGLVLAIWLTKLGVPLRIIDKQSNPLETSRAIAIQARTLEFYAQLGLADEVIANGIIMDSITLHKDGRVITKLCLEAIGDTMSPFPFVLSCPQDQHEKILIKWLDQHGIQIERQTELLSCIQNDHHVYATLHTPEKISTIEVDYLCGCDGAHSTVRDNLHIGFIGSTYHHLFYVADTFLEQATKNEGIQIGISQQDFSLAFPVRDSNSVRLIGIVPPNLEDHKNIHFAEVRNSVMENLSLTVSQVNWFSTYHVHHRIATRFQNLRTFLLGDAAHIHSPVGGQGMNTGIGDAVNLAWKLGAVLHNQCSPDLLNTYELERIPFAKKLVATTDRMFQIITEKSLLNKIWRHFIFPKVFPFLFKYIVTRKMLFRLISQIGIQYRHSPLSIGRSGKLHGGDRLPWIPFNAFNNYEPLKNLNWQIHVYGKARENVYQIAKTFAINVYEFSWDHSLLQFKLEKDIPYLIRPDGYIAIVNFDVINQHLCKIIPRVNHV